MNSARRWVVIAFLIPLVFQTPVFSADINKFSEQVLYDAAEAIDRVGMAAGLGLLASQANGQITGLRTTYDVTGHEKELANARLKFQIVNNQARQQPLDVTVPLRFSKEESHD